jgi:hypothetical protein
MNFIERFLGLNPDQGSGLVEYAFVAIAMAAVVVALRIAARKGRWRTGLMGLWAPR